MEYLPTDIVAQIHYTAKEMARRQEFDIWRYDFEFDSSDFAEQPTETIIDNKVIKCSLDELFAALKMDVDPTEVDALRNVYKTDWDTYKWYQGVHDARMDTDEELSETDYCEMCGQVYYYDGPQCTCQM